MVDMRYNCDISDILHTILLKNGCKGTNIFRKNLQYRKKVVPLHPHFGKTEAFDDVNRLVIRSKRRLKDVYANNI
jgi:hypothetical protein